ncbi:UDP-N-acetylmuramoyl-L-alanine--D-glutamate ligase [Chrysiogenes arsenatis]|uniref:UDP-N-acetylmuramoyl-L-alanine--D-glutamate ligase n=1 Tax=Chrysiogenes arsenatis TaxID=309797 RepID=UPI00040433FE|nr:UDP-N-acetylmuramoyl-L-alanine--D-glutamate ligase [Chrysiogenes arsenatis]
MEHRATGTALILGAGASGLSAARFLRFQGYEVVIADDFFQGELPENVQARLIAGAGSIAREVVENYDLIVASPGIDIRHFDQELTNDIELFYQEYEGKIVAVTGTNGKSTVTSWIAHALNRNGIKAVAAGNIGTPPLDTLHESYEVTVIELSSFQLETISTFLPNISIVLNITDDHLDRYDNFEQYANTKFRIAKNQTEDEWLIVNGEDEFSAAYLKEGKVEANVVQFIADPRQKTPNILGYDAREVRGFVDGKLLSLNASDSPLQGLHNMENLCAVAAALSLLGLTAEQIKHGIAEFHSLPHRMAKVLEHDGVTYIDDSKGTNIGAMIKGIQGQKNIILIAGGRNKGSDFRTAASAVAKSCKLVIAIGESKELIYKAFSPVVTVLIAEDMADAVSLAAGQAVHGDTVMLCPGCSSFDMFTSYSHRGDVFSEAVRALADPTQKPQRGGLLT